MGNKIVTEADRKRTPASRTAEGLRIGKEGGGQKVSRERGVATRSKKNPGKRPHKGGSWTAGRAPEPPASRRPRAAAGVDRVVFDVQALTAPAPT